ncbi:hypothetical protein HEAFMP_HEAFMP_02215, partial [Dysosmobacter welbionis]
PSATRKNPTPPSTRRNARAAASAGRTAPWRPSPA